MESVVVAKRCHVVLIDPPPCTSRILNSESVIYSISLVSTHGYKCRREILKWKVHGPPTQPCRPFLSWRKPRNPSSGESKLWHIYHGWKYLSEDVYAFTVKQSSCSFVTDRVLVKTSSSAVTVNQCSHEQETSHSYIYIYIWMKILS